MSDPEMSWDEAEKKLGGAEALTNDVRAAVEKYLTRQIGHPRGCGGYLGSSPGYPDREDVKNAVNLIWDGLCALYRLDPAANEIEWASFRPFVSDMDNVWLFGGGIAPSDQYR